MMPISEQTAKFIDVLETEGDHKPLALVRLPNRKLLALVSLANIESKLRRLLEREFLRRLTGYRLTNRLLSQKYGMDYNKPRRESSRFQAWR